MRIVSVLSFFIIAVSIGAEASELRGIRSNNEGVRRYQIGRGNEAYEKFTGALADLPFDPVVHVNLGDAFLVSKDVDKALSEYAQALKLAPGSSRKESMVRFHAHFNSAIAYTEKKMIDQALESYQKALGEDPNSVETKTNIELLSQSGGGGQGDEKSDKKDESKDGQGDQPDQPKKVDNPKQKPKPKPFDSKELTQQDVNRILDELKQQEEQIRAKMERQGAKDAPNDKDW